MLCLPAFAQQTALEAARESFDRAATQPARFEAAREVALVHTAEGRLLAAQVWLRRAANYAPDRAAADRNREDFRQVRARSGLRPSLSFNIRPSDNINNGVQERIFALGDILLVFPTSALALSGVEYTALAELSVRLSEDARQRTALDVSAFGQTYSLSPEARRLAPSVRGSDYALAQLAFGISHARQVFPDLGPTEARLSAGKVWYAGEPLRRFQRLDLTQGVALSGARRAQAGAFFERQVPLQPGQPQADLKGVTGRYQQTLPWQDSLVLTAQAQRYDADIATYTWRSRRLRLDYGFARPLGPLGLSLHAEVSDKIYDDFSLSLNGRRDETAEFGLSVLFNEISAFGFSPSVTVSARRTRSNVARFDTQGVSASLGLQSRF